MSKIVKIKYWMWQVIVSFFFIVNVSANTINSIDMDVFLDEYGDALVKEVWNVDLSSGTEGYRSFSGLGDRKISDFVVTDEEGRVYESLDVWNTEASFNEKSYKSAIYHTRKGVELCWGISVYGKRVYNLEYKIKNFVTQYTDTQGIYFNFLKMDQQIENVKIKIHSDIPFSVDNAKIWAFGYDGNIIFNDNVITMNSNGTLKSGRYMVGLIRFEENIFKVDKTSRVSFDEVYDEAFRDVNISNKNDIKERKDIFFAWFQGILISIIVVCIFLYFLFKDTLLRKPSRGVVIPDEFSMKCRLKNPDVQYNRDIPCDKDIFKAYFICRLFEIKSTRFLRKGIIGAILLKWLKEKRISIQVIDDLDYNEKNNEYIIDLSKMTTLGNKIENELLQFMLEAAGENKLLESKEFPLWCHANSRRLFRWFINLKEYVEKNLAEEGILINNRQDMETISILTEEALAIMGLEKFMLDFGRMADKSVFEVTLWEEYLIFAELLGIAKKVAMQLREIYPEFFDASNFDFQVAGLFDYFSLSCVDSMDSGLYKSQKMKEQMERNLRDSSRYDGSSRDSGGGGDSFSGGGSSAGGSSGGGFR